MNAVTDFAYDLAEQAVHEHGAMQKVHELAEFIDMLQSRPIHNVLEIGGMHGGTMWVWNQLATGTLICVDSFRLEGRMTKARGVELTLINADSHQQTTTVRVADILQGEPVDLLFIDGDHSYKGVRQDFEMYAPLVRLGGCIAIHDVSVEQPARNRHIHDVVPFWNQIRKHYYHHEIYDPFNAWGGIGVLWPQARDLRLPELGQPTDEERKATVSCDDPCNSCGNQLILGEDTRCARCAA